MYDSNRKGEVEHVAGMILWRRGRRGRQQLTVVEGRPTTLVGLGRVNRRARCRNVGHSLDDFLEDVGVIGALDGLLLHAVLGAVDEVVDPVLGAVRLAKIVEPAPRTDELRVADHFQLCHRVSDRKHIGCIVRQTDQSGTEREDIGFVAQSSTHDVADARMLTNDPLSEDELHVPLYLVKVELNRCLEWHDPVDGALGGNVPGSANDKPRFAKLVGRVTHLPINHLRSPVLVQHDVI